ncbi:MAG TPA: AAA family ATPase [Sedimentisphaerales bacterium]|nr:AAA family ATPase [Sedimentisphaerales bacterium]
MEAEKPPQEPGTFRDCATAIWSLEQKLGVCLEHWVYRGAESRLVGAIVYWKIEGSRRFVSLHPGPDGRWRIGPMPDPRPLFNLPDLLRSEKDERVFVAGDEMTAAIVSDAEMLAVAGPWGPTGLPGTDWRPLAGRNVAILADRGPAGGSWAKELASILQALEPPACVRIMPVPEDGPDGKVDQWTDYVAGFEPNLLWADLDGWFVNTPTLPAPVRPPKEGPVVQCFADVVPSKVRWLWPGRLALGRITLLVGRPGEGKSFLTTDLAARVSTGRPWPDGSAGMKGSVLYICAEDDPSDTIRPRLDAHGADVTAVHLLSEVRRVAPDGRSYTTTFTLADVPSLEEALRRQPECRLVVVDPIGSFLGNGTDSYRDSDVRALLDPVGRLAQEYGPAILLVAHRRKSVTTGHADDLAMGSRAFTGVARAVWHLTRDPHNHARRLLVSGKNNLAAEGQGLAFTIEGTPPAIRWEDGVVSMTANDALAAEGTGQESQGHDKTPPRGRAVEWLRELLRDGPLSSIQVQEEAKSAGFAWRTVHRAKDDLRICPFRDQFGGSWIWRLPAAENAAGKALPAAACPGS